MLSATAMTVSHTNPNLPGTKKRNKAMGTNEKNEETSLMARSLHLKMFERSRKSG